MTVKRTRRIESQLVTSTTRLLRPFQLTLEELLFKLCFRDLDLYRLVYLLVVTALVVGVVLDGGGKERIDEGGLPKPGLASNLGFVSLGLKAL